MPILDNISAWFIYIYGTHVCRLTELILKARNHSRLRHGYFKATFRFETQLSENIFSLHKI